MDVDAKVNNVIKRTIQGTLVASSHIIDAQGKVGVLHCTTGLAKQHLTLHLAATDHVISLCL